MIVYLDLVIISMLFSDYAILKTIAIVFKDKVRPIRFILSLSFSILSLFLFLFPFKHLMFIRYFMGIIIVLIAFKYKNYKDSIIKIVTFYLLNIAFVGTIIVFNVKSIYMLVIALFYVLISKIIENYQNIVINENRLTYKVKIGDYKLNGYLDTGNFTYYKGLPVVFIKDKYLSKDIFKISGELKLKGIDGLSIVKVYEGPPMYIDNTSQIVYYVFNNMIDYDVILNRDFKEGINVKIDY